MLRGVLVDTRPTHHLGETSVREADQQHRFLKQPRAVWAVAFACVIAFMGIGLVDPILKPIADQLDATPSQVSLLFTSYMAVMGVAMLSPASSPAGSAPSAPCSPAWR